MEQIAALWIAPGDVVVDTTFGRGAFWKNLSDLPTHSHDIKDDGVDCRSLPYENGTVDVVVVDPPYRPTHGSKGFSTGGNGLAKAYQLGTSPLDSINDVIELYRGALTEAFRVARPSTGRVLVKTQDLSYGHRLHLVSWDVLRVMTEVGFEFADQFILVNKHRLTSGAWKKQERARRSHSVMWIGIKEQATKESQ